jgi:hypothetical protein
VKEVMLPSERSEGLMEDVNETFKAFEVQAMGFSHLLCELGNHNEEKVHKIIKYAIDHTLAIEGNYDVTQRMSRGTSGTI